MRLDLAHCRAFLCIPACVIGRQNVGSCIAVQRITRFCCLNHDAQIVIHCSHDEMPELRLSTFFAKDIFEKLKEARAWADHCDAQAVSCIDIVHWSMSRWVTTTGRCASDSLPRQTSQCVAGLDPGAGRHNDWTRGRGRAPRLLSSMRWCIFYSGATSRDFLYISISAALT